MQIKVNTNVLKELVTKSIKGVGNNKLIPITSLLGIKLIDGLLTLITTDGINYLYVFIENISGDDFNVTVDAEKFSKLISKLTCEQVSLEVKDNILEIVGNGTYKIELPLDENGELIDYPDPYNHLLIDITRSKKIDLSTIQIILNSVKPSLSTMTTVPCYTGYYVGDKIVATDSYKIASLSKSIVDKPILISSEMMDLLSVMDRETLEVNINDDIIVFSSDNCVVYGRLMSGIDDFQIKAIDGLLESEFDNVLKVSKQELLQALDRLSLFVTVYDKNSVVLECGEHALNIYSTKNSAIETIDYVDTESHKKFKCLINIELFMTQVKAQTGDIVEIHYGKDNAIKLVDNELTYIVALLEE